MTPKNISLEQTMTALKELTGALSACSAVLNEKKINAGEKDAAYQRDLQNAQEKIDILAQSFQNAIANINELTAKIDKVLN